MPVAARQLRILYAIPGIIPSTYIGGIIPFTRMHRRGKIHFRLRKIKYTCKADIEWCDIVVFSRNTENMGVLATVLQLGKPYIYEIDDNFFEIDRSTELGRFYRRAKTIDHFEKYLTNASQVRVYSTYFQEYLADKGIKATKVPAYFDHQQLDGIRQELDENAKRPFIEVCCMRSPFENGLQDFMLPALQRLINVHGNKVRLNFWGKACPKLECGFGHTPMRIHPYDADYGRFLSKFRRHQFDISLAPGLNTPFFNSKTENKYREFGALGVPGVYSHIPLYTNCVTDGKTGLLVPNTEDGWFNGINRLINDIELRVSIVSAAQKDVIENYSYESFEKSWLEAFESVTCRPISNPTQNQCAQVMIIDLDSGQISGMADGPKSIIQLTQQGPEKVFADTIICLGRKSYDGEMMRHLLNFCSDLFLIDPADSQLNNHDLTYHARHLTSSNLKHKTSVHAESLVQKANNPRLDIFADITLPMLHDGGLPSIHWSKIYAKHLRRGTLLKRFSRALRSYSISRAITRSVQ